ncbi:MAG TPA: dTMP kinase [Candidatus Acidoferrales bacterium]|nr:dTMP kinase [Candidatus Acidoferrales bacterium]
MTAGVLTQADPRHLRTLLQAQEKKRGFLIAFEGPDGSGKTTQRKLFKTWLRSVGHEVVTFKWNESPVVKPLLRARKLAHSLSPEEYCVLSAAGFRQQLEQEILPALWDGKTVLADRYLFTAFARDAARGLELGWIMNAYLPLFWPDMVFYFEIDAALSSQRVSASRKPKYYEAGQDITNISDPIRSHRAFVARMIQEYDALAKIFQFLKVDGRQSIYEQHREIRKLFMLSHRRRWAEWNTDAVLTWLSSKDEIASVQSAPTSQEKDQQDS